MRERMYGENGIFTRQGEAAFNSEEELENAKMSFHDSIYGIGDTPSSYINWYFGQFCKGISLSQDELHEKYQSVTIPQLVEAANTLTLDTIYLMDCKKEAE